MEKYNAFPYYWFIDDKEQEITSIRIYAIDENNQNVCIKVNDFTPWIYLELPDHIQWTASKAQLLGNKLDELLGKHKPLKKSLIMKHKLYGAHLESGGKKKKFPYLFCSFSNRGDIKSLGYVLRKRVAVVGVGTISIKMHEQDADPILQLVSCRDIPTAGWITFHGKPVPEIEKITLCDKEFNVKFKNLFKCEKSNVAKPKIMGFDIEVNSTNPSAMPKSEKPGDKIFQISCVFAREGCSQDEYDPYILTLGEPDLDYLGDNVTVHMYETEADLLKGFTELINTENPNIISGYNILGFDIPYMIDRAKFNLCIGEFDRMGFHKYNHAKERTIKWSSSAYKDQEFQFLDAEGRIFVDLLPLIKRDFKMDNYRLKTVSEYFIGDTKDDLSVKGIFKCYRIGTKKELDGTYSKKAQKAMAVCAKYCIQDSVLVVKLMEKLQTWVGLCEMAKTCNTSIFSLYTQGQQIKVFSQVYKHCLKHNIVVEKDGYIAKEDERYVGAHVFPPVPGVYDRVLPFDFCFTGDTLVTMSNGTSRRIDSLERDELVLGYNKEGGFQNYSTINGLQRKGLKETIKIYLQDGRSISCTPEHKFMLSNGEWCEAKNLKGKEVMSGIEYPEDIKCPLEDNWSLKVDGYEFNMKNEKEREKSLAFARMVGYILSDGSIYESKNRKCVESCFGTVLDAENFKIDLLKLIDKNLLFTIRKRETEDIERSKKGITYCITLHTIISKMIHSLKDIIVGKRSTQKMKLPKFILDDDCPNSIIKQFLGGLYGGDCCSPFYRKTDGFGPISFKWTTIEKYTDNMTQLFENLKILHKKLGIDIVIYKPILVKYRANSIRPKDYKENPRYDIQLNLKLCDTYLFSKNIGFHYCLNKACRLTIASSYQRMCDKTREQHSFVLNRTIELIDKNIKNVFSRAKNSPTFKSCLKIAQDELLAKEPAINIYSLSSVSDIGYQRHEMKRHFDKDRRLSLQSKKFPKPKEYIMRLGVEDWFSYDEKSVYFIKSDDMFIPSYKQKVIDIYDNGLQNVYDIEVEDVHNFLVSGIVAHNCSLYPTVIIAYNIDFSTLVTDDSIPDEKCNVMTWGDHISCKDDPKVIRKNKLSTYIETQQKIIKSLREKRDKSVNKLIRQDIVKEIAEKVEDLKPYIKERSNITKTLSKNVMCAERNYRFLKEPKGVIPTILQNLLDARANTRVEIKKHKKEIELLTDQDKINELKLLNNVLDKRQLAYKISSNSMYGSWGVRKGYLPFMPGAMCLVGDSQISFSYGFTRKMKNLVHTNNLWSYNKGQVISDGNGLKYNGKKEVVKITLLDGRTLRCTPDHKIMTPNGWIEAGKLLSKHKWDGTNFSTNSEYSKVIVGLELPEDIVGDYEKGWKILNYTMDTPNNREKTLAFCRILGFILADGSISSYINNRNKKFSCKASLGTLLDANIFVNDIKIITGKEPSIRICERTEVKGDTFSVHIPKILVDEILMLDNQPYIIPSFLFETNCPLSVVREFLGGLFGGDGTSSSLSVSHLSFSPIQFRLTTIKKYKEDMNKLIILLGKFDLKFLISTSINIEFQENPEFFIKTDSRFSLLFAQKIGFRYCADKNNKLTVAASYQRYLDNFKDKNISANEYTKLISYDCNENTIYHCLCLDIIDVKYDGFEDVYDIIDVPNHSFFSNGIVVHNCTTYMGRTNIEIVADTIQKKYRGELVYGD